MEYAQHLSEKGYVFIPGEYYISLGNKTINNKTEYDEDLAVFKRGFEYLVLDPYSPGNRWRGYAQCRREITGELLFGKFVPYRQTKAYNPDTGGIVRDYPLLPESITGNRLLRTLLMDDMHQVQAYGQLGSLDNLTIGIHLFRYQAAIDAPAFSSPVWLHKDDEDIVFIHLINATPNMLGGDNLIASNVNCIERVLQLEHPFDTLVVNHDKYHTVTPIGVRENSGVALRDIVLITFQRNSEEVFVCPA